MSDIEWIGDNMVQIKPPSKTKKITGTRFATVLGLNPWATEFETWCSITKVYEKPFDDNKYTAAGKTIEPKQAKYMETSYGMSLIYPKDTYGEDYFKKTRGDFFPDQPILSGMWDFLLKGEDGKTEAVLEMKTTKRAEDWKDDVPEYYALQAALYAYLLGVDDVIMVASFLEEKDYDNPEGFVPSAKNTITVEFKVSERYPDFKEKVARVEKWWNDHVVTGISPQFDEKRDAEILNALRTSTLSPDTDIKALINEGEKLKEEIDDVASSITDKEKRLKEINDIIKQKAVEEFKDGDTKVEVKGEKYVWVVSRSERVDIDRAALENDGLLKKYSKKSETYRLTVN